MISQEIWSLLLVAAAPTIVLVALGLFVGRFLRRRIRSRMAGIDNRLDDLQCQVDSLQRLVTLRLQLRYTESLVTKGEDEGKLSGKVAAEMKRYLQDLSEDLGHARQ